MRSEWVVVTLLLLVFFVTIMVSWAYTSRWTSEKRVVSKN